MHFTKPEVFQPDTVSPLDCDAVAVLDSNWDMEVRLPNLIRGAARSRRLAVEYKRAAWEALRSARAARSTGDRMMSREHLDDAIDAGQRASQCVSYARRCEKEANAIAVASGFLH